MKSKHQNISTVQLQKKTIQNMSNYLVITANLDMFGWENLEIIKHNFIKLVELNVVIYIFIYWFI